jgi:hypothetical protein
MTNALSSFGTLIKIGDGATPTENFTTIAELLDIDGVTLKTNTEDATNHSSPSGYEDKIPTTLAVGPVKFGINFIPTSATHSQSTGLIKDWKNKTPRGFKLVFPDIGATTWTFVAYVTSVDIKAPVKGKLRADVTLDITGSPTLAG